MGTQCGVGHLEGHLEFLEALIAEGKPPGQALLDRLPRDKEKNLRPESVPVFVSAILAGQDPEEALVLAFERDTEILLNAANTTWKLGNEAEDLRVTYQDSVASLTETICDREVHLVGACRVSADNPASVLATSDTVEGHIANIRFLIANLWMARKWLGDNNRQIQVYKKAIGVFSYELPNAVAEGRVLVQRDRERMRNMAKEEQ